MHKYSFQKSNFLAVIELRVEQGVVGHPDDRGEKGGLEPPRGQPS